MQGRNTVIVLFALSLYCAAQVKDMERAACEKAKDRVWITATQVIPGDGTTHVEIVVTGPKGYDLVGGHAFGLRQGVDDHFTFTCPMSPAQGPANADKRKCTSPGNDLSAEQCTRTKATLTCEYVNSTKAGTKVIELGGCFDD